MPELKKVLFVKGALIMARIIRFPLKMKNGAEVRSLDELKENFDLESILGYFTDGKLQTWLADRYYDEKANEVAALSSDMPDLNAKLCKIFEVEYKSESEEPNIDFIQRRNEKLKILCAVTADQNILNNVDFVAMDQDDLYDILDEGTDIIYLYGEKFEIPIFKNNILYIGVNKPIIVFETNKTYYDYDIANISFKNTQFTTSAFPLISKGEKLFLSGKYIEALPYIKKSAENDNPRAMFILSLYFKDGYGAIKINEIERKAWLEKAFQYKEPISSFEYLLRYGSANEFKQFLTETIDELEVLSINGDIFAKFALAYCYCNGNCKKEEPSRGIALYLYAAEQGFALAQYEIGNDYYAGHYELEENEEEAIKWFTKAAKQGLTTAQDRLGYLYYNGYSVDQSYSKAFDWYSLSAEQGESESQFMLGNMYFEGLYLPEDLDNAITWYTKSAEQGYSEAQFKLGQIYDNGDGVTKDYEKACKYFLSYAKSAYHMNKVGKIYEIGDGVSQNYDKALKWYIKAVEMPDADEAEIRDTCISIGRIYDNFYNNYSKAYEWYQKAFTNDISVASTIGGMYEDGENINQDYRKAFEWYKKGAERNDAGSQVGLGRMYGEGKGVDVDTTIAAEWYTKAIELYKEKVEKCTKEVEICQKKALNGEDESGLKLSSAEMNLSFAEMDLSFAELGLSGLKLKDLDFSNLF